MRARSEAGVLSICFDDFPKSAWTEGGRILRRHGTRATYFLCGGLCGKEFVGQAMFEERDVEAILGEGHELGCHTFDHMSALRQSSRDLLESFERNARFVSDRFGDVRMVSFAYPYGDAPPGAKRAASRTFACARGVDAGLNRGRIDLAQLKAVALEAGQGGAGHVLPHIAAAAREQAWLIVFTHDVSDRPSRFGCTPAELATVIASAESAGLEILTVKGGLAKRAFRGM
jgi:peptidoglycan/xylan/chitin deacetylase (PgdA/CDA1 family)